MRISLTGFMGSGKSTYGKELARVLSLTFIDLDTEIEQQEGKPVAQIFEKNGEEYFREIESGILHQLMQKDNFVLACGGGVPLNERNRKLLNKESFVVFLKPLFSTTVKYLKINASQRPLISHFDKYEFEEQLKKLYQSRLIFYRQAHLVIDPDFVSPDQLAKFLKRKLFI